MAMSITQDTFDEVVKENMEDFGMDREAAAGDAVEQFKAQGADLSMVDTSADGIRQDARAVMKGQVEKLSGLDVGADGSSLSELVEALSGVGEMCREDGTAGEANRTAFGEAGGVGTVARFLGGGDAQASLPNNVVSVVLATLCDACKDHERNRDAFIYTNMAQLTSLLLRWTNAGDAGGHDDDSGKSEASEGTSTTDSSPATAEEIAGLVAAGLKLVRTVCAKTENNKGSFMRRKGAVVLKAALERYGVGEEGQEGDISAAVTREACAVVRSVTLGDDRRKDFSGTYDSVKALVSAGLISLLLDAARAFEGDSATLSTVYLALKQLAANDESVKMIVEKGGLEVVSATIVRFPLDTIVCRTGLALFRNISGNDMLKTRLLQEDGLRLVLGCMSQHPADKTLQEHGCATMAAMALRSPSNGARIVSEGGITSVLEAMRQHPTVQGLQRQACLCIRNIAARGPELRSKMLDEGCETALREAGKVRGCVDEAYGALRDLQCEVGLVTMGEGGKIQVGIKAFGEDKPNFNPSLQQTRGLDERIEGSSTAPKHAGYRL
eukprot:jgi/Undpi1/1781/HiC_scaffold_12.g05168.m1